MPPELTANFVSKALPICARGRPQANLQQDNETRQLPDLRYVAVRVMRIMLGPTRAGSCRGSDG